MSTLCLLCLHICIHIVTYTFICNIYIHYIYTHIWSFNAYNDFLRKISSPSFYSWDNRVSDTLWALPSGTHKLGRFQWGSDDTASVYITQTIHRRVEFAGLTGRLLGHLYPGPQVQGRTGEATEEGLLHPEKWTREESSPGAAELATFMKDTLITACW